MGLNTCPNCNAIEGTPHDLRCMRAPAFTISREERDALRQVFRVGLRGGDVSVILRSNVLWVMRKRME